MATLLTLDPFQNAPEVRPLPSTGVTRLRGTTSLSATPHGPACPSRASGWHAPATAGVSRVASISLCRHAVAITPVGPQVGSCCSPKPTTAAFPIPLLGRLPHYPFRGLLGVHSRYGLPARGVAQAALSIEGFGSFVTSTPLRLLPAGATVAGWELHPLKIDTFSRRTKGQVIFIVRETTG